MFRVEGGVRFSVKVLWFRVGSILGLGFWTAGMWGLEFRLSKGYLRGP